mgnify:CR=1 FL=1
MAVDYIEGVGRIGDDAGEAARGDNGGILAAQLALHARDQALSHGGGARYGAAAMADGLLERMEEELGQPCTAVATGGLSGIITPYCRRRIRHDDSLLLRGLALIWRKNCENR